MTLDCCYLLYEQGHHLLFGHSELNGLSNFPIKQKRTSITSRFNTRTCVAPFSFNVTSNHHHQLRVNSNEEEEVSPCFMLHPSFCVEPPLAGGVHPSWVEGEIIRSASVQDVSCGSSSSAVTVILLSVLFTWLNWWSTVLLGLVI